MADSTCVMQSFARSTEQQQGASIRALGESVSFGRFMTETLHWEKFSPFNQNRYVEEAQSFSKPGLVAQKRAFFEAHFKKTGAGKTPNLVKATKNAVPASKKEVAGENLGDASMDKTPNLVKATDSDAKNDVLVPENDVANENLGEPCLYMDSTKSKCGLSNKAAPSIAYASCLDHKQADPLMELLSGEGNCHGKNKAVPGISESDALNNSHSAILVRTASPDASQCLEVCDQTDSLCDTRKIEHMVAEPKSFERADPLDALMGDQSEVEDNSTILLDVCQDKMVIQNTREPITGDNEPALTSPNASTSVGKLAVRSHTKPKPLYRSMKENNAPDNTTTLGNGMLNKKAITSKSLHMSVNQDLCLPVAERHLATKKSDSTKYPSNTVSSRGSKEHSNRVFADLVSQKRQATSSKTLFTTRKSSAEQYLRSAPPRPKKEITMAQKNRPSVRSSLDIRKSMPKPLHKLVNFCSHVGEKEAPAFLQRTGTKGFPASVRITKTHSTHEPAKQVLLDASHTRTIPPSDASTSSTQFHAKPIPPLHPSGSRFTQSNSARTLSYIKTKNSLPTSRHMLVDLSTTVIELKKPSMARKSGNSTNTVPAVRVSRESCNPLEASLQKSLLRSAVLQSGDRSCPGTAVSLIRPPPLTAFTPFRFRSHERAAKRKEKLEEKLKVGADNPLQSKASAIIKKCSGSWNV